MKASFRTRVGVTASLLTLLVACGGAAETGLPGSPKSPEPAGPEPTTIEEAQRRIAAAKAELGGAPGGSPAGSFAPPPPAAPPPPPPAADGRPAPAPPMPSRPSSPAKAEEPDSAGSSKTARTADDRCGGPCRAVASMRRAVTALCRMTGDGDARCVDAKRTLADSEGRVSPCSC